MNLLLLVPALGLIIFKPDYFFLENCLLSFHLCDLDLVDMALVHGGACVGALNKYLSHLCVYVCVGSAIISLLLFNCDYNKASRRYKA